MGMSFIGECASLYSQQKFIEQKLQLRVSRNRSSELVMESIYIRLAS